MPGLDPAAGDRSDVERVESRPNMGLDRDFDAINRLAAAALVIGEVIVEHIANGMGPLSVSFLSQRARATSQARAAACAWANVLAVSLGHVIGRAKRAIPAPNVRRYCRAIQVPPVESLR